MNFKGVVLALAVTATWAAVPAVAASAAGLPPPTLIKSPCRGEDIESMIGYYVEKTVDAQLKSTVQATLWDFGTLEGKDGKPICIARLNVGDPGSDATGDLAWVHYRVSRKPELTVQVSFSSLRARSNYTLPTDEAPAILHSSLLAQMPASRRRAALPAIPSGISVPIGYLEIMSEARKRLLAAGWMPKKTLHPNDDMNTAESAYMTAGYVEVDSCAIDVDVCSLDYVDAKGDCLYVTSESEEPKDAFVGSWNLGCQPD